MNKKKIAILGATSHIAKGLIKFFLQSDEYYLHLHTRSKEKMTSFLSKIYKAGNENYRVYQGYEEFDKGSYDCIINCVGVGTQNVLQGQYERYFTVTEKFDNMAIEYLLQKSPETLYISFSSGAVYGRSFENPAEKKSVNCIEVNNIESSDYYSIARLNAEAKHRSLKKLNIVDLRIFAYFSRYIDLADGYFITELISCIKENKMFTTNNSNFARDFLHPQDLFLAVKKCIELKKINGVFDISSKNPVEKKEILDYFTEEYNLKVEIGDIKGSVSATGTKNKYYSNYNNNESIGYKAKFSSLDTIIQESKKILT